MTRLDYDVFDEEKFKAIINELVDAYHNAELSEDDFLEENIDENEFLEV